MVKTRSLLPSGHGIYSNSGFSLAARAVADAEKQQALATLRTIVENRFNIQQTAVAIRALLEDPHSV